MRCGDAVDALLAVDPDPDDRRRAGGAGRGRRGGVRGVRCEDADLLAHLGTGDVARDMEAIRRALGDEPLNYLGFSYGTHIGQPYAEHVPGARPGDGARRRRRSRRSGSRSSCSARPRPSRPRSTATSPHAPTPDRSSAGSTDLGAAYDRVRARSSSARCAVATDPSAPPSWRPLRSRRATARTAGSDLGPALGAALDGDGGPLWDLAASYYDFGGFTSYAAVVCIDTPPPAGADGLPGVRRRGTATFTPLRRSGRERAGELRHLARRPRRDAAAAVRADGAPPILVVGNTGDAATPYAERRRRRRSAQLGRAAHRRAATDTRPTAATECATSAIDDYLIDLTLPAAGTVCGG